MTATRQATLLMNTRPFHALFFSTAVFLTALFAAASLAWPTQAPSPNTSTRVTLPELPDLSTLEEAVASQIRGALSEAEKVLGGSPDPSERAAVLGEIGSLLDAYDFTDAARDWYREALVAGGDASRWTYALGYLEQRAGDFYQAASHYRRVIQVAPNNIAAQVHLAEILRESGDLVAAAKTLKAARALVPDEPSIAALSGQIALDQKDFQSAAEAFRAALEAVPGANRLHYPLALAYRGLGDLARAQEHLEKRGEVGVRPPDPWVDELEALKRGERVHILSGRMAFKHQRFEEAAEHFARAVEAKPDAAGPRINLSAALSALGKTTEAMHQLRVALEADPDNPTVHYNLGQLLLSSAGPRAAQPHLERVVEITPNDGEARKALGDSYRALGQIEEALEHYQEGAKTAPFNEPLRFAEASTLVQLGRFEEAIQRLDETVGLIGPTPEPVRALARLLAASPQAELRDGERALELSTELFSIVKTAAAATVVAESYAELGRCEEAAEWQQKVVDTMQKDGGVSPTVMSTLERYQQARPCRPPGDWQQADQQ